MFNKTVVLITILLLISSCAGYTEDPTMYDTNLWIDDTAASNEIVTDPAFHERLHDLMYNSAMYWNSSTANYDGWRIRIKEGTVWCNGGPGYGGCTDPWNMTVTVSLDNSECLEASPLLHEFGHVMHESSLDTKHSDPLWYDWDRMAREWEHMKATSIPLDERCQSLQWSGYNSPPIWGWGY
jgi:hypothetical protein